MKSFRSTLAIFISFIVVISSFSACGKKDEKSGTDNAIPSNQAAEVGKLPITDKKITLKYWVPMPALAAQVMKDYNENSSYRELEKRTGIRIEFLHPVQNQVDEQFNLMIASGDLPDLIGNATRYQGGGEHAIAQKVYLKLNDLVDKYAPNYQALRKSIPEIAKQTMNDNGSIWCFYQIVPYEEVTATGPVIKKEWLDELGLKEPVTLDDWYTMLKAFKEKKGAEAPLLMGEKGFFGASVFISAFDTANDFIAKDGKVKFGPIEPGMKGYLETMSKWYKEGLIDKDFPTRNAQTRNSMISSNKAGAIVDSPDTMYSLFKPLKLTVAAPDFPVGQPGQKLHYREKFNYSFTPEGNATTAISTACKYPVEAVCWLDYGYGEQGHLLFNYGVEGEAYKMVEGKPVFTELIMNNPDKISMNQLIWKYKLHDGPFKRLATRSNPIVISYADSLKIRGKWTQNVGTEYNLPPITLTAAEGEKAAPVMNTVNTYKDEMILKFIMGIEPVSKFDEYVNAIKKMGIDAVVQIRQDALDRYDKRK